MNDLRQDLRFALKLLRKDRVFLAAALLTLALCIGANTAIFSILHSVLLRPLRYPGADRLVALYNSYPNAGAARAANGVPDYYDRLSLEAFDALALYGMRGVTIGEAGNPERVLGLRVTPSFFPLLRVAAVAGRTFSEDEGEPGNDRRAVLSHALWQRSYGGREDAVGRDIRIDGVAYSIVGVMPEDFTFGDPDVRLWLPLAFTAEQKSDDRRHSNNFGMIGRLRDGASIEQARTQVDALNARNDERFPQFREILHNAGFHTVVTGYREDLTREAGGTLYLLQGGVLLVLLIGCVNIANLILVRSTGRTKEYATRYALGAGRWRMARQLVTECLVLAVAGGALGVAAGYAGMRLMTAQVAEQLPRATEIGLHATTLAATAGLALFAGVFFGTIPLVGLFRADLSTVFRQEGRTGTSSRRALAARGVLVATQVSLAFALLIAAGLLLASFGRKLSVRTGFAPEAVVTASVSLPVSRYGDGAARRTFVARTLEGIRALPAISAAGVTNAIPFGADFNSSVMTPEGYVPRPGESPLSPAVSSISPGYFEAMGIPIVRGRPFDARDASGAPLVVIVDEWLAQRYWPDQDPVGKRLYQGVPEMGETPVWRTIVGVAKEIRFMSLAGDEQVGHYYYPYDQAPTSGMFLTVRTSGDPLAVVGGLRSEVTAIDPDLPVYGVETMMDRIADSMLPDRVRMTLTLVFAGVALLLAAVGIYGVLAYMVAQRTREIGIRMALGSGTESVFRLVLGQGLRLLGIGLALGIVASLAIGRVLRGMLYGVTPADPLVFAGVLAVLGSVAVAACVVPAVRACRIAPATALGTE